MYSQVINRDVMIMSLPNSHLMVEKRRSEYRVKYQILNQDPFFDLAQRDLQLKDFSVHKAAVLPLNTIGATWGWKGPWFSFRAE